MERIISGSIFFLSFILPSPQNQPTPTPIIKQEINLKPTPTVVQKKTYEVKAGDTLDSISKEVYGSGKYWTIIWNENDWIKDPRVIKKGWELSMRIEKPKAGEELKKELVILYNEITKPTPTPTNTPQAAPQISSTQPPGLPSSFDEAYKQAGSRYGVPWQILYGLHLTESGLRDGAISSGYGTGAQGPMQFMPATWTSYGVDGNGDGVADINNAIDAIYGAASYLAAHGGVDAGLKAYGGDTGAILTAARSRGY